MSAALLRGTDWEAARACPLAGDASTRIYRRLSLSDRKAILMESPDDTAPFLRAARHLAGCGLSVPRILAEAPDGLLLEDFGDATFAALLRRDPGAETGLYAAATDLLVDLHRHPPPEWAEAYDPAAMGHAIRPAWTHALGADAPPSPAWCDLEADLTAHLDRYAPGADVLLHRDYHAENLIWLSDRTGVARVGLLDFQDALAGHRAYDLTSLLQDARRDLSPGTEERMIARYCDQSGQDPVAFGRAYALQAVQRHLRILGIFARLARERGRPGYLDLVPRVRGHLDRALSHPDLTALRRRVRAVL